MAYRVDNAVILAAGMSSRFAPLSYEYPKALIEVKGEILIERQIRQIQEAGINEIVIVVGYKKEQLYYLKKKFGVILVENKEYEIRNNHSSIYAAKRFLKNSYICSADHYFCYNPFEAEVEQPYYAAVYADGNTDEWCIISDRADWITKVTIGGSDQWCMMGHAFWNEEFSRRYISILENEYRKQRTKDKFWETIYQEHIGQLKLKIRKYPADQILEFDSLDELRRFDKTYITDTRSGIVRKIADILKCKEEELTGFSPLFDNGNRVTGILFKYQEQLYRYIYTSSELEKII